MNIFKTIRLKALFKLQDILKEELFECKYNYEEQQIREELADVDYQIKSFKLGD